MIPLTSILANLARWAIILGKDPVPRRLESVLITFHALVAPTCKVLPPDFLYLEFSEQQHMERWLLYQFTRIAEFARWGERKRPPYEVGEGISLESLARNVAYSCIHQAEVIES